MQVSFWGNTATLMCLLLRMLQHFMYSTHFLSQAEDLGDLFKSSYPSLYHSYHKSPHFSLSEAVPASCVAMRLLKFHDSEELSLIERTNENLPPYAILSHTWGADDEEVSYKDLEQGTAIHKPGYAKIQFCAKQADQDGLRFFWVDTCCINKADFTELSEAINSMFRWYREATRCYVYLSDVPDPKDPTSTVESAFPKSRWFKRGWTLQELIAPSTVQFFSQAGQLLGSKMSRLQQINEITGIDIGALRGSSLSEFSLERRVSWTTGRETKKEEDAAYCLLGIFDIHMPLIYGEGRQRAFDRLQRKVRKSLDPTPSSSSGTSWFTKPAQDLSSNSKDLAFEKVPEMLKGHMGFVYAVVFSPNGELLALVSHETIQLWNTRSWTMQQTLKGLEFYTYRIAFSPNGELLAQTSFGSVQLWDTRSWTTQQTLKGYIGTIGYVAFSPNAKLLAMASGNALQVWNTWSWTTQQTLESDSISAIAFSPNGELLALATGDTVQLWDTRSWTTQQTLKGHMGSIWGIAFSLNSGLLASTSIDTVQLWDTRSWTTQQTLESHAISAIALSPNGKLLALASGNTIQLWDTRSCTTQQTFEGNTGVIAIAFSPNSELLVSASRDQTVRLWNI